MTTHLTHWGAFEAISDGERLTEVRPWPGDPEPMPAFVPATRESGV